MKITFISTLGNYWGGSEELWTRTASLAISEGHCVQIAIYNQKKYHPALLKLINTATSCIFLPEEKYPSNLFQKVKYYFANKLRRNPLHPVSNFKPEIILINQVHNYSAAFNSYITRFLSQNKSTYVLLSQFNQDYLTLKVNDRNKAIDCYTKAFKTFFVSKRNLYQTEHQLARSLCNASVIDNPLNLKELQTVPWPETNDTICFASVARLECSFKGQDILLSILSKKEWKERSWHLNFYGTGPDEVYLKDLVDYYKLNKRVTFHGHLNDVRLIWANNHILLLPSLAEGKPLALEEALVCGRPAVVSDVAGNTELVEEGLNGFVASSFFIKPFEAALERAWRQRDEWQNMGYSGHKKMLRELDFNPEITLLKAIVDQSK